MIGGEDLGVLERCFYRLMFGLRTTVSIISIFSRGEGGGARFVRKNVLLVNFCLVIDNL